MHLVLLALLAQEAAPAPNGGTEGKIRAQALLTEGSDLYERGDFRAALQRFEAAYALYPSPKLWLNIGQANRDLGRPVDALEAFERFIAAARDAPPATIAEARRSVIELRARLGRVSVASPIAGADVSIDGKRTGVAPLPQPIWVTPGRHRIGARQPGFVPVEQTVDVSPGSIRSVTLQFHPVTLVMPPAQQAPVTTALNLHEPVAPDETPPIYRRWPFWAVVGGGIALGVVIVAASSGHAGVPHTTLGAQRVFQ
jgi:hypothetical protein